MDCIVRFGEEAWCSSPAFATVESARPTVEVVEQLASVLENGVASGRGAGLT